MMRQKWEMTARIDQGQSQQEMINTFDNTAKKCGSQFNSFEFLIKLVTCKSRTKRKMFENIFPFL